MTAPTAAHAALDTAFDLIEEHGGLDHPDGTGPERMPLVLFDDSAAAADLAEHATVLSEQGFMHEHLGGEPVTWRALLLEQTFHAIAQDDPRVLRARLVELAAFTMQWVESIDRRSA